MSKEYKYDLIIPIVRKDLDIVLNNIDLYFNNLQIDHIILIGSKAVKDSIGKNPKIEFVNEDELIQGLSLQAIKQMALEVGGNTNRSGWYFQQFLKIGYSLICKNEYYLVWDSDTIPLNILNFFSDEGKPFLSYRGYVKHDQCYQSTLTNLLSHSNLLMHPTKSFITEHMLFNTSIMRHLINDIECNEKIEGNIFFEKIFHAIPPKYVNLSGFSEFEAYSAYVLKYYSNIYTLRYWKNLRYGKIFVGQNPTQEQLNWISKVYNTISLEKFNRYWIIFRVLSYFKLYKIIHFKYVIFCFYPFIETIYQIRVKLRNTLKK